MCTTVCRLHSEQSSSTPSPWKCSRREDSRRRNVAKLHRRLAFCRVLLFGFFTVGRGTPPCSYAPFPRSNIHVARGGSSKAPSASLKHPALAISTSLTSCCPRDERAGTSCPQRSSATSRSAHPLSCASGGGGLTKVSDFQGLSRTDAVGRGTIALPHELVRPRSNWAVAMKKIPITILTIADAHHDGGI
jgi:hypothetical protein